MLSSSGSNFALGDLPPSMRERAKWARNLIIEHPEKSHIDEDDFVAWVYHEDDHMWYSIDGHYSAKSPEEKMSKRRELKEKQEHAQQAILEKSIEIEAARKVWEDVRLQVLERDNYTCQFCFKKKESRFHVHHIQKRDLGGPDTLDNLVTVCPSCHPKAEKISSQNWDGNPV
jgi:hypothetical protein